MRAFEPTARQMRRMLRRAALIAGCVAVMFSHPIELGASSRDSDASRMQARQVDFPSRHSDSLNPPKDRIDWRYFKLQKAARVSLRVDFDKGQNSAEMGLVSAAGRDIVSSSAADKRASIARKLEPGIYYIRVQSSEKTAYKLYVRD